jgi:hypothetical protein
MAAILASALAVAGCGDEEQAQTVAAPSTSADPAAFDELTGADVIEATKAEGTATLTIEDLGAPADPGTDHGSYGQKEDNLTMDVAFDFARNRARTTWVFPSELGSGPTKVEVRTVDGTSYVRDGSWLCPGCPMDGEALPSNEWITFEGVKGDLAFDFGSTMFHHQLAWLSLVDEPLTPGETSELDHGTKVASYGTTIPVDEINAAGGPGEGNPYASSLQGKTVRIQFTADSDHRLHELVVDYHIDDRARTQTATVEALGAEVEVEVPPQDEIYVDS